MEATKAKNWAVEPQEKEIHMHDGVIAYILMMNQPLPNV
jgi:hypothetical protein